MRRMLLCLSFVALLFVPQVASADWGTLRGRFVWDGDAPTADKLNITKDVEFCGKHGLVDEELVVNPDNNGVANIVLFISPDRGKQAPEPHESYADTATATVRLDNLNCRYEPHVALLRTTQKLVVGNKDPIGHNSQINTIKNPPKNPMIPANEEQEFEFPKEERLPVTVKCSIHPWMTGYVLIKDSPYMAVTDADGNFVIENLPEGEWSFQVWNGKYVSSVKLDGKKTRWSKGKFDVKIKAGDNDMGEILIDKSSMK